MTWRQLKVSADRTHHLNAEKMPAYNARFDAVLSFHEPGLAPVEKDALAWHIHSDASPAYARRFKKTFGFYEEMAAVESEDGWLHIHPSGAPVYPERYAWCGNFQGGRCPVRYYDNLYSHLGHGGQPAYSRRWRYAGDYRDEIAVVQALDGRHSHIDLQGELIHGVWFEDLDIFHKDFARARDQAGWTHISKTGRPNYSRRFAAVEPFYNGQARVERFDGGLEVIDESGCVILELRPERRSEFSRLSEDLVGFWRTKTIGAAVRLGLIEALPGDATEIAERCNLNLDGTIRLLRALSELQLLMYDDGFWSLTERGTYLRSDHPLTLADAALEYSGPFCEMWNRLPGAVQYGISWSASDLFGQIAGDMIRCGKHHRMLASYAAHDYKNIISALNIHEGDVIVDAGGGPGILARIILAHHPSVSITVLDRPEVVELGKKQSSSSLVKWRAADIFDFWNCQADVVLLSRVLHDWDDDQALQILKRARETMKIAGRVFIIEMLLDEKNASGSLCDLHLLLATGGRERTARGYNNLLIRAGFEPGGIYGLALPSVIAGMAV